ncbi:uncharacterized protein MYCFIDRAFT_186279 [Pseudocercospora fijiensis CIRAD86]|uniref:Uncharacterized protein n=1 Tax=Pseudocercospora fijiensis (strain CIRAD86) TaxID=383855 RepID=M3A3Y6_PSEFD|nr:uncharacterized protein MYCFIDRAFT_186279 [Pseudocercospora fijiensis CIRAD86]EME85809.1 hypothetical protein MYCFIDRAFT_186279 [Pseudocercospora fijiensis CIRAD86]
MEARELERARRDWKDQLSTGMTTEPFKAWSQANAPALQQAMQYGAAERAMYEREQYKQMGPAADRMLKERRQEAQAKTGSQPDLDRNDQRFRDIEGRMGHGFPRGEEQVKEMQGFIKDQVARVPDDRKNQDYGNWKELDKLYQRMILKPAERVEFNKPRRKERARDEDLMKEEDLSEDELRECVPMLWNLVP